MEKKKKIILITIGLIVLLLLLGFFGYKSYLIFKEYHDAAEEYQELKEANTIVIDTKEEPTLLVDFAKLSAINPEVVAWIRFEEPEIINYPIVQAKDNEKYLVTTFEGVENGAGCIYMDAENAKDFSDRNTFIYGHYRKNGHMFGALRKYKDENYCKNHSEFEIYTPDGMKSKYKIFATTIVNSSSDSYRRVYVNDEEFQKYIDMVKELSLYKSEVEVAGQSNVVSLSTCMNVRSDERLLIHAVRTSQEKVN